MGASFPALIMLVLLGGGSGNHLLDYIPSDHYWKAKDVEVKPTSILLELASIKADDTTKSTAVRRLMAIRALGELKSADSIGLLRGLLDSKEPFVAEYAQSAIDAIEGKPSARPVAVPADRFKSDVLMLPEHCGAVVQAQLASGGAMDLRRIGAQDPAVNLPGAPPEPSRTDQLVNGLLGFAESMGDVRLDGITIGVSDSIGPQNGFIFMMFRGRFDSAAMKEALKPNFNETKTVGDLEFMTGRGDNEAVIVPSDELFITLSAPTPAMMPMDECAEALKAGKGKLEANIDLMKIIESADMSQPTWAAMQVTDSYKQAPMLAAFESITAKAKRTDQGMSYQATGNGKDADAVKAAVDQITQLVGMARSELSREAGREAMMQPIADFFGSVELKADGATATATAVTKKLEPTTGPAQP